MTDLYFTDLKLGFDDISLNRKRRHHSISVPKGTNTWKFQLHIRTTTLEIKRWFCLRYLRKQRWHQVSFWFQHVSKEICCSMLKVLSKAYKAFWISKAEKNSLWGRVCTLPSFNRFSFSWVVLNLTFLLKCHSFICFILAFKKLSWNVYSHNCLVACFVRHYISPSETCLVRHISFVNE